MKKIKITLLLIISILSIESFGDIIITKSSKPAISACITNLNDFPEIQIIVVYECLATEKFKPSWYSLDMIPLLIYDACPFTLYAVKKGYLNDKDRKDINLNDSENVVKTNISDRKSTRLNSSH